MGKRFIRVKLVVLNSSKPQGSDATDYGDGYGSDLMGDEEDRARLMAMNELDREMILADRSEARDREREKRKTAQLLKQRQREVDQVIACRKLGRACH